MVSNKQKQVMAELTWGDRHNVCAFLYPTSREGVKLAEVIRFLLRSRIYYAISVRCDPCLSHQREFWGNAVKDEVGGYTVIKSKVFGQEMTVSRADIQRILHFDNDDVEAMLHFNKLLVKGCFMRMGYDGDIGESELNKACLSISYKYLFHVVIHCLGPTRGGFDVGRETLQSAVTALVLNRPYNFSGMIFHHMKENLVRTTQGKFLMYPRFVQMLINERFPNLPKLPADFMKLRHMTGAILYRLEIYKNLVIPPVKRMIGHLANENYVAPPGHRWRNDGSDSDEERLVNPIDESDDDHDQVGGGMGVGVAPKPITAVDAPLVHLGEERESMHDEATEAVEKGKGKSVVDELDGDSSSSSSDDEPSLIMDPKMKKLIPRRYVESLQDIRLKKKLIAALQDPSYSPPRSGKQKGVVIKEGTTQQTRKRKLPEVKDVGKEKQKKSSRKKRMEFVVKSAQAPVTQASSIPISVAPLVSQEIVSSTPQVTVPISQALARLESMLGGSAVMTASTATTTPSSGNLIPPTPVNLTFSIETVSLQDHERLQKKVEDLSAFAQLLLEKQTNLELKYVESNKSYLQVCDQNRRLVESQEEQRKAYQQERELRLQLEGKILMLEGKLDDRGKKILRIERKQSRLKKRVVVLRKSKNVIVDFVVDLLKRLHQSLKNKPEDLNKEEKEKDEEDEDEETETESESVTESEKGDDDSYDGSDDDGGEGDGEA